MITSRILRWGDHHRLSQQAWGNHKSLYKEEAGDQSHCWEILWRNKDVGMMLERGHEPRNAGTSVEGRKGKERNRPLEPPEGTSPAHTFTSTQWDWFGTSKLCIRKNNINKNNNNLNCFKIISLYFIAAVIERYCKPTVGAPTTSIASPSGDQVFLPPTKLISYDQLGNWTQWVVHDLLTFTCVVEVPCGKGTTLLFHSRFYILIYRIMYLENISPILLVTISI